MSVEEKDDGGRASPKRAAIGAHVVSALSKDPAVQHVGTDMVQMFACPDFLSMDECEGLIAMIDADCFTSEVFDPGQARYRTSQSCNLDSYHPLVSAISKRICLLMQLPPEHGETLQGQRSEEHTSELQSLMRISYAVFCLKKKNNTYNIHDRCTKCI